MYDRRWSAPVLTWARFIDARRGPLQEASNPLTRLRTLIEYELSYEGLQKRTVTQGQIHFGSAITRAALVCCAKPGENGRLYLG